MFWFAFVSKREARGGWVGDDIPMRMKGGGGCGLKTRAFYCHNESRKRGENGGRSETSARSVVLMDEDRLISKGVGTTERTQC